MMKTIKPIGLVLMLMIVFNVSFKGHCINPDYAAGGSDWRNYSDTAADAAEKQDYAVAEKNFLIAIDKFVPIDDAPNIIESTRIYPAWVYEDFYKVYMTQGRYDKALELDANYQKKGKLLGILPGVNQLAIGDAYLEQGKFREALKEYQEAYDNAKNSQGGIGNGAHFTYAPRFGRCFMQMGEYEKAEKYLQEVLDYFTTGADRTAPQDIVGKARHPLACAYYYAGDLAKAKNLLGDSIQINAGAFVTFSDDLAQDLIIIGRIDEQQGNIDKSIKAYQSAENALLQSSFLGYRVLESDVAKELGRTQLKQGNATEAEKSYARAKQLREATDTQTHPNYADILKGLADVASAKGDYKSAQTQAAQALKVLDDSVVSTHPRCSQELVALSSLDALTGKSAETEKLNQRLGTILQKPLGPPKQDFLNTCAFYAKILKKNGKNEAASRLEQIVVRQKDKR